MQNIITQCPQGVDVFFDNTAGPINDAVMKNLSTRARRDLRPHCARGAVRPT
jgi:NADPH-dependent curcumin reductase CurA